MVLVGDRCMSAESPTESRRDRARVRAEDAHRSLAHCELCAHRCGINRLAGELGPCRAGPHSRIFSAQVEVSDELELSPCFAIAFSGCDLRCSFCITGAESWNPQAGDAFDSISIAAQATGALTRGARTIMILGGEPTVHLPAALELVSHLPNDARLIWKTNAHGTEQSRALLEGFFDIWLADFKFGNDDCAERLARVSRYTSTVQENLIWAHTHTNLIVRHLLMPGHTECCWRRVAEWLAETIPGVKVNLRSGFWSGWQARRHEELRRLVSQDEERRAAEIATKLNLKLVN